MTNIRVAEPGDGGDENDAVDHGALDVFDEAVDDDYEADKGEPEGGAFHAVVEAEDVAGDCAAGEEGDGAVCRLRSHRMVSPSTVPFANGNGRICGVGLVA